MRWYIPWWYIFSFRIFWCHGSRVSRYRSRIRYFSFPLERHLSFHVLARHRCCQTKDVGKKFVVSLFSDRPALFNSIFLLWMECVFNNLSLLQGSRCPYAICIKIYWIIWVQLAARFSNSVAISSWRDISYCWGRLVDFDYSRKTEGVEGWELRLVPKPCSLLACFTPE